MMNSTGHHQEQHSSGPDDLLVLAEDLDLDTCLVVVAASIGLDGIVDMTHSEQASAFGFLSMTPDERAEEMSFLDDNDAVMLILRARWMGLRSEKLHEMVDDLCAGQDMSFREIVVQGAMAGDVLDGYPNVQQILSYSL